VIDPSQSDRELRKLAEGRENILELVSKAEKSGNVDRLPYQNYLVRQVLEAVAADVKADADTQRKAGAFKKFAQYLSGLDPNIVALRAIQTALHGMLLEGAADMPQPIWKRTAHAVGRAVYSEYLMLHFSKLSPPLFNSLLREYSRTMTKDEAHMTRAFKAKFKNEGYTFPTWAFGDLEMVGNYLLTLLHKHKFIESWSATEFKKGKAYTVRYMQLDFQLRSASISLLDQIADMPKVAGPLIEAPLPWDAETNTGGGYHTPQMQRLSAYAVQGKGLGRVAPLTIDTINELQSREWAINQPVLQAVQQVSLTHSFGDIVGLDPGPKPEMPWPEEVVPPKEELKEWKALAREWYTDRKIRAVKHERYQRAFREARDLSQYPGIWFVYYADFRGRVYARSSSVSPQGTDLEKGLLRLKSGRGLNSSDAETWFRVHGANKWGLDKEDFQTRVNWSLSQHDALMRMASDPVSHHEWTDADAPVQFLAWVFEYAEWQRDPGTFLSYLPMSQDGTCNGLQNFSALMCDPIGGAAVNLTASPAPRDIYTDVAVRVIEALEAKPHSYYVTGWLTHMRANPKYNRKLTKRPTMTLPYGSTRFATSSFIMEYIEDRKIPALIEIEKAKYGEAANFLSHVIWAELHNTVGKALEVMDWLKGWAKHAAQNGHSVGWVAPSGLHVVSEYDRMKMVTVKSVAFKSRIKLYKPDTGAPDLAKIANAVAPNFVHSLDASHLAMVVRQAKAEGMQVVAIHDDFGVHAADTARFHEIIREQFVLMYEGNTLLADMAAATGYDVPPPEVGDLDLREILKSPYFFA
jgi:DNA-directed RNA polymerase